jgi:hypothetical protein
VWISRTLFISIHLVDQLFNSISVSRYGREGHVDTRTHPWPWVLAEFVMTMSLDKRCQDMQINDLVAVVADDSDDEDTTDYLCKY